jgi:hypothetical protein
MGKPTQKAMVAPKRVTSRDKPVDKLCASGEEHGKKDQWRERPSKKAARHKARRLFNKT